MRFLILCALLIAGPALACERVNIGMLVTHFESGDYNENGPLVGCEGVAGSKWNLRYMRNSHSWDSFLLTRSLHVVTVGPVALGGEIGLVTGYREKLPSLSNIINPALAGQFGKAWPLMQKLHPWAMATARLPISDNASTTLAYFGAGAALVFSVEL